MDNVNIESLEFYYTMMEYLSAVDQRPKFVIYRLIKEKPKKKKQKPPEKWYSRFYKRKQRT